jgi:hypothetical protein
MHEARVKGDRSILDVPWPLQGFDERANLASMNERVAKGRVGVIAGCLFFLVVVSVEAQVTWRRTYGGFSSDEARSVLFTEDGGFLFLGSTGSFGEDGDIYALKASAEGTLIWSVALGGEGAQAGVASVRAADGYAVAGITATGQQGGYDVVLTRLSDEGAVLWQKEFGSDDWDLCNDMQVLDDGFVLVGVTYSDGSVSGDAWVVRTDMDGDTLWTRRLGGDGVDEALAVLVDDSGDIVVCGSLDANGYQEDAFVAKFDAVGELLWLRRFGGDSADYACGIAQAPDGGYVMVGATDSYSDVPQVLIRKISVDGDSLWQREYGTLGETRMRRIVRKQGGYAMIGFNTVFNAGGKDMFMILVDEEGFWELGKNYGSIGDEMGSGLEALPDGGFILAGWSDHYGPGIRSIYAVRCAANGETADDNVYVVVDPLHVPPLVDVGRSIHPFPNPSTGRFSLSGADDIVGVEIYDALGRSVAIPEWRPGQLEVRVDLPPGHYLLHCRFRDRSIQHAKLILIRP